MAMYDSPEQELRVNEKITFIGLYCKKCKGRERYLKNRQCYYCKQQTNKSQYEKSKDSSTGEVGGEAVGDSK